MFKFDFDFNCSFDVTDNNHTALIDNYRTNYYKADKSLIDSTSVKFINEFDKNVEGRFRIKIDQVPLECLYIDGNPNYLFVSYSGARSRDSKDSIFPRWSYYKFRNACFIGIDDPMYSLHPGLSLGWFYGTKKCCFIDNTLKLVNQVCNEKNINLNNCIFFSSSGGGYASILAAIALKNTLSISINPQLYIYDHALSAEFQKITKIDLLEKDPLNRNNLYQKIKNESSSKHVIIVNMLSYRDYQSAIKLTKEFGVNTLRYGLNVIAPNVLLWIYEAQPEKDKTPHETFETRQIYKVIEYISLRFKEQPQFNVEDYQTLAVLTNEIWFDITRLKKELSYSDGEVLTLVDNDRANSLCTKLIETHDTIHIQNSDSDYKYYNLPIKTEASFYSITFHISDTDLERFSYGVYDWNQKTFIKIYCENIIKNHEYVVNIRCSRKTKPNISILIYAGIFGKTSGNSICIKNLTLKSD